MGEMSSERRKKRWIGRVGQKRGTSANAGRAAPQFDVFRQALSPARAESPAPGQKISDGLVLYHDATAGLFSWHQTGGLDLVLTCYQFHGTYLSLAAAIDSALIEAMRLSGEIDFQMDIDASRPISAFVRLNIEIDDRRETLHETLVVHQGPRQARFDLDRLGGATGDMKDAWIDLIFAEPEMSEVLIRDLRIQGRGGMAMRGAA